MDIRRKFNYKRIMILAIGVIVGGITGYFYLKYVVCTSGNFSIKSVWYNSTLYGMLLGGMVFDLIQDNLK